MSKIKAAHRHAADHSAGMNLRSRSGTANGRIASQLAGALLAAGTLTVALSMAGAGEVAGFPAPSDERAGQYRADVPKSIIDLQQFRTTETMTAESAGGGVQTITLTNLNPFVNTWLLLTLSGTGRTYHLENAAPGRQQIRFAPANAPGLMITEGDKVYRCDLWDGRPSALERASITPGPYGPLCDGRLYLRNPVAGHRTGLERVADFLRDKVWCGDIVVGVVRDELFRDAYRESGTVGPCSIPDGIDNPNAPKSAALDPSASSIAAKPPNLGIRVDHATPDGLLLGRWYPAKTSPASMSASSSRASLRRPSSTVPASS